MTLTAEEVRKAIQQIVERSFEDDSSYTEEFSNLLDAAEEVGLAAGIIDREFSDRVTALQIGIQVGENRTLNN